MVASGFGRAPLGVNLGKNKLTPEDKAADDYVAGVSNLGGDAEWGQMRRGALGVGRGRG